MEAVNDFPKYPKIHSIFKRDEQTHKFRMGEFALPEFEYLADNQWIFTEKVDGTNIRIGWDGENVRVGGRTDNAQMPTFLHDKLSEIFTPDACRSSLKGPAVLYGEGYGARIQKGGGNYIADGVGFILFDIRCGRWWLTSDDVETIADSLGVPITPVVGAGTIQKAIDMIRAGLASELGQQDFLAEGLVLRPRLELAARNGERIIAKLKHKDFA